VRAVLRRALDVRWFVWVPAMALILVIVALILGGLGLFVSRILRAVASGA